MKKLIVNADDFALTDGISSGIARLMDTGAVTSTSVMTCAEGAEGRVRRHAGIMLGRAGVHLQLTAGRPRLPAAQVKSLVTTDGSFFRRFPAGFAPNPAEVEAEWTAQVEALLSWGIRPTHLDGHHHAHMLPSCRSALLAVARRFGLPVRAVTGEDVAALRGESLVCPDVFVRDFDEGVRTAERFLELASRAAFECPPDGVLEIMVHPGEVEPGLYPLTSYAGERGEELAALSASGASLAARRLGLAATSFACFARDFIDRCERAKE